MDVHEGLMVTGYRFQVSGLRSQVSGLRLNVKIKENLKFYWQ
jgi:hypothetical protein